MPREDTRVVACWSWMLVAYSCPSHNSYLRVLDLLLCMGSDIESCGQSRHIAEMKCDHIASACCSGDFQVVSVLLSCTLLSRGRISDIPELAPTFNLLQQTEHQRTAKGQCNEHHVNTHSSQWRTSQSHTETSPSISQPGIASARAISQARKEQVRRGSQRYACKRASTTRHGR
jgi:hypothetical protein